MDTSAGLKITRAGEQIVISLQGSWTLACFESLLECCNQNLAQAKLLNLSKVEIDAQAMSRLDTTGAKALLSFINKIISNHSSYNTNKSESDFNQYMHDAIVFSNFNPEAKLLIELVGERLDKFNSLPSRVKQVHSSFLIIIGQITYQAYGYLQQIFSFLGQVSEALLQILWKPKLFRIKELVTQLEDACVKSIPVVVLVTFLIGVVVAYLMAIQIEKYGGHIFVVNGVALAMCRELSPIIVAVVMAGRSGSAYTAQIGAMRLNEEVDALTTIGLSVMHVLVIPRFLALVLSMPLLVFIGDLIGISGGMFIAESYLGITYTTFIDRLQLALPIKHFIVGMVKAPVFAAVIALIGCRRGLTTEMNARSVGLSTTATVVESIVLVILLNAAFAVIFAELGI